MANQARIVKDPKILGGKPIIEGTRLSVSLIQEHVASGFRSPYEEIGGRVTQRGYTGAEA